jgi:hypothetical protein
MLYKCNGKVQCSSNGEAPWKNLSSNAYLEEGWHVKILDSEALFIDGDGKMLSLMPGTTATVVKSKMNLLEGKMAPHGGFMNWIRGFISRQLDSDKPVAAMTGDSEKGSQKINPSDSDQKSGAGIAIMKKIEEPKFRKFDAEKMWEENDLPSISSAPADILLSDNMNKSEVSQTTASGLSDSSERSDAPASVAGRCDSSASDEGTDIPEYMENTLQKLFDSTVPTANLETLVKCGRVNLIRPFLTISDPEKSIKSVRLAKGKENYDEMISIDSAGAKIQLPSSEKGLEAKYGLTIIHSGKNSEVPNITTRIEIQIMEKGSQIIEEAMMPFITSLLKSDAIIYSSGLSETMKFDPADIDQSISILLRYQLPVEALGVLNLLEKNSPFYKKIHETIMTNLSSN